MSDNKNQHYVPRCHLKPFSFDREGVAINLFNHRQGIIRENVPISGQCAKSYFYGKDLIIEKQLQTLEERYAGVVRQVENGAPLTQEQLNFLRSFAVLQWCRTDAALRRRREAMMAMEAMAHGGLEHLRAEKPDLSQRAMVLGSLNVWASAEEDISDLRVLLLRNLSQVDFVTCDDPAVVTNRVFLQRMRDNNFGITNVGAILLMPLGPRHALISYDHDCYAPIGRSGCYVNLTRDQDARAFNELQFLNSLANIYFAGPIDKSERIVADFNAISDRRPSSRFVTWQGISEGIEGGFECFRRIKDGEQFDPRSTRIQSLSPLFPVPAHWMSCFAMRAEVRGWVRPGAVGGPVRYNRARRLGDMELVKVGVGPMPGRGGELPDRMYHRLTNKGCAEQSPNRGRS